MYKPQNASMSKAPNCRAGPQTSCSAEARGLDAYSRRRPSNTNIRAAKVGHWDLVECRPGRGSSRMLLRRHRCRGRTTAPRLSR